MKFRKVKGRKAEGDEILLVETVGEEAITLRDIAEMVVFKYYNENLLYPPTPRRRGGEMVMDFLRECIENPNQIDLVAVKYKLSKGVKLTLDQII